MVPPIAVKMTSVLCISESCVTVHVITYQKNQMFIILAV